MMFIMFISAYLVHAATSFVGILIIAGFSLIAETAAVRRRISPLIYYAINVIIFFTLIIGNKINSFLAFFVVKVLNKNLTFSNRRAIWDKSIDVIKQHAKFGIGYRNGSDVAQLIGMQHSHNMYLWHGVRGGIPYLLIFAAMLFMAFRYAKKARNQAISQNAMLSLFVIMLMWQFEVFGSSVLIFTMIYFVWNIDKFSCSGDREYYESRRRRIRRGKRRSPGALL
jgi:O-antigen ligase